MERGARVISLLNSISGYISSTKTAAEAIQTSAASIDTSCNNIESYSSDIKTAVNAGGFYRLKCEVTRPDNTTAYHALDAVGAATVTSTTNALADAARANGGTGSILRVAIKTDNLSWTNAITMVVYDGDGPAAYINDHAAFDPKYVDASDIVATISFPAFSKDATGAAGSYYKSVVEALNIPYKCGAATSSLYFQLFLPSGTPTPASSQKFYVNMGVVRD